MSFPTYERNYNVGNIRLDTPYTHFVYELPLLSFGDVLHTVNLSLVYQSKMSGNPYNIAPGFGLNLQKKLSLSQDDNPSYYESGNGEKILLNNCDSKYVFDDGSQRIIRGTVLENPDFSTENYNSLGNIMYFTDKYENKLLEYQYYGEKLLMVSYRPEVSNKKISLSYINDPNDNNYGNLKSISYLLGTQVICTTNLVYLENGGIKVQHYSGVDYYIIPTETSFTVYSRDYGVTESKSYYHSIECNISTDVLGNKAIVANSLVDTSVVDSVTYNFLSPINGKINVLDITNFHGVTTRTQYIEDKPRYSYELSEGMFETRASELYHVGNVNYYNNDQVVGKQSYGDGISMTRDITATYVASHHFYVQQSISGLITVSGWLKPLYDIAACTIIIDDGNGNASNVEITGLVKDVWNYFSVTPNKNYASSILHVYTSVTDANMEACDFRLSLSSNSNEHLLMSYDLFIDSSDEENPEIPFSTGFAFYKGCEKINEFITAKDVLRYKINKMFGTHKHEIYYGDGKGVISTNDPLNIKYFDLTGKIITKYITDLDLGKKHCFRSNSYVTLSKIEYNPEYVISTWQGGKEKKRTVYDTRLDIKEIYEGEQGSSSDARVRTTNTRTKHGLIESQEVTNLATGEIIANSVEYNANFTKLLSTTDEFGVVTKYTTDPTWGVVTQTVLRNQDNTADEFIVTDTFDADLDTQYGRNFTKDGLSEKEHNYKYDEGRLSELTDGSLKYEFTYSAAGDIFQVVKNSKLLEVHIVDNNRRSFTTNYGSHSVTENYDKYGRLAEISGQIQNEYDINPTASGDAFSTVGKDNADAKLSKSTDLVTGNVTKYAYEKDRVSRIGVFNSSNTQTGRETFTYDLLGRKTYHSINCNIGNVTPISHSIAYATNTDSPLADNRIRSYQCYDKGTLKSRSVNGYDNLKRLTSKNVTMHPQNIFFEKSFTYEGSRISKAEEYYTTINVGTDEYEYDEHGRITEHTFTSDNRSDCKQYYYDSFGQLIRENNKGLDKTFVYEYDSIGNIVKVKTYGYTTDETLSGNYTSKTYSYTSAIKDALTKVGNTNITYDNFGRPVTYGDWTFVWTNGRLARMCDDIDDTSWSSSEDIRFNYNGYGQRISKSYSYDSGDDSSGDYITGTSNAYDYDSLGRLIHERFTTYHNESATVHRDLVYLYDESGIIGVLYTLGGTTTGYYYRRNLQGDVVGIYDKFGTRMAEYAYDAFGNCSLIYQSSGTDIGEVNPIRYRSYYYDHETGMYYLGSRYYNPQWRRFISLSTSAINPSVVNGLNSYTFMGNKPIDVGYGCSIAGKYTHSVIANFLYDNSTRIANARSTPTLNSGCLTVVPRWVDKVLTAIDHSFSIINPIRTASYISKYPNLWNLMRLDGVTDLPGALSKTATGIGWGICAVGGAISGYEKYASGASLISSIAGGVINAGISIGGMYAATGLASYGMGLLIAANVPGGIVVVSGAIIAIGVGALINHLATEVEFMGNTLEDHINNIFDWLIFWD